MPNQKQNFFAYELLGEFKKELASRRWMSISLGEKGKECRKSLWNTFVKTSKKGGRKTRKRKRFLLSEVHLNVQKDRKEIEFFEKTDII